MLPAFLQHFQKTSSQVWIDYLGKQRNIWKGYRRLVTGQALKYAEDRIEKAWAFACKLVPKTVSWAKPKRALSAGPAAPSTAAP